MSTSNAEHRPTAEGKRPYHAPELKIYGDIVKNTKRGKGAAGGDTGQLKSTG